MKAKVARPNLIFIDLRSKDGRQSSISITDEVTIVGVLPHGAKFSLEEFQRFCKEFLTIMDKE